MGKRDNLKPFKKGEKRAKTLGAKGGKSTHPAKSLAKRVWCNPSCPLWPCWAQPQSEELHGGKCGLKAYPLEFQVATYRLCKEGPDGFFRALTGYLSEYIMLGKTWANMTDKERFENVGKIIDKVKDVQEAVYGKKAIIEGQMQVQTTGTLSIKELKEAFHKYAKKTKEGGI